MKRIIGVLLFVLILIEFQWGGGGVGWGGVLKSGFQYVQKKNKQTKKQKKKKFILLTLWLDNLLHIFSVF